MRRNLIIPVLLLLIATSSCVTEKRCNLKFPPSVDSVVKETIVVKEVARDTVVYSEPDRSEATAKLEVDSLTGEIVIGSYEPKHGKQVPAPKITIKNSKLTAECEVDSMAVYLKLKERHITKTKQEKVTKTKTIRVNYLTGWQWFSVYIGRIAAIIAIIYLLIQWQRKKKLI